MSIIESGLASAGASVGLWSLFYLFRKCRDKTRVVGCWLPIGKTYAEKHFSTDGLIFIDLDGALSVTPLNELEASKRRLEIYPKAREKINEYKQAYKNNVIVILSSDYELLKFIGLRKKTLVLIPNSKWYDDNKALIGNKMKDLQTLVLNTQLASKKKRQVQFNNFDNLTDLIQSKRVK